MEMRKEGRNSFYFQKLQANFPYGRGSKIAPTLVMHRGLKRRKNSATDHNM